LEQPPMTPARLTVKDAVDFALKYRKDKVFKDHSPEEIAQDIFTAIQEKAFGYSVNAKGELVGIVVCRPERYRRMLHVSHCLAIEPCLRTFARLYYSMFPGWHVSAIRRGVERVYKTKRLIHLMESL
jgi:hypothetical protein